MNNRQLLKLKELREKYPEWHGMFFDSRTGQKSTVYVSPELLEMI